jgi:hypothetical protein
MDGRTLGFTRTQRMSLKKVRAFFGSGMLQLFDFEQALIDQRVPFDRDAR